VPGVRSSTVPPGTSVEAPASRSGRKRSAAGDAPGQNAIDLGVSLAAMMKTSIAALA